jgi:hypothetical protein
MEEDIFRTIRRKYKNRVAARKSRDRKCQRLSLLLQHKPRTWVISTFFNRTASLKIIRTDKYVKLKHFRSVFSDLSSQLENLKKILTVFQRSVKYKGSFKDAVLRLRGEVSGVVIPPMLEPLLLRRFSS